MLERLGGEDRISPTSMLGPCRVEKIARQPHTVEEAQLRMTAELQLRVEQARASLIHFYHLVFTTEDGDPVFIEPFHHEWCKVLQDETQLEVFIEGSRETTKTSVLMAAILWAIGKNPNIRILWVSENADAAEKRIATINHYLTASWIYKAVFPDIKLVSGKNEKRKNNQQTINVEREAESQDDTVRGVGVLSPGTGSRCDILVLDDAVGHTNAVVNPANKPRVLQKILSDWIGTVSRLRGRIWAAFNPWADDDAMSYLKKRTRGFYKVYAHGKFDRPGLPDDPYASFCERLWTRQRLIQRRRILGEVTYLRSMCCRTKPRGKRDLIVHPDHLRHYSSDLLDENVLPFARCVISADPASGRSAEVKEHQGTLDYNGVTIALYFLRDDLLVDPTGENTPTNHKTQLPPRLQQLFDHLQTVVLVADCFRFRSSQEEQARLLWLLAALWGATDILAETVGLAALHTILDLTKGSLPQQLQVTIQQLNTQVHAIPVGNQSKGQRLLQTTPYLNPPAPTPPAIYFHPGAIPFEPEEQDQATLDLGPQGEAMGLNNLPIERPLRKELLDFPQKNDDAMDSYTQAINWVAYNNPPFIEDPESESALAQGGLRASFISVG